MKIRSKSSALSVILLAASLMLCGYKGTDGPKSFGYDVAPYMNAMSKEQSVYSDERVDIDILALGKIEELDGGEEGLHGFVKVSNKTDAKLPYSLQECVVNGYCFSVEEEQCIIRPKCSYISEFFIENEELEEVGIDSISSVGLFLMADFKDNLSADGGKMMGGRLYDIPLDLKGKVTSPGIDGEIIYDEKDVRVYLLSSEYKTYEDIGFPPAASFELLIENSTDRDLSFDYSKTKCDGIDIYIFHTYTADWDEEGSYENFNFDRNVIPHGCKKHDTLRLSGENVKQSSTFLAQFEFTKPGGGQLLFGSDEIELKLK